jgi:hypothetical protein
MDIKAELSGIVDEEGLIQIIKVISALSDTLKLKYFVQLNT